jgi:uncharacterized protein YutE (UPF0331/DUF86 family)
MEIEKMDIDKEKIKKRFSEINNAVKEIKSISALPDKDFWAEKKNIAALKYYLLQAIESVGNISAHIVAKVYNLGVSSFGECFDVLEKEGILNDIFILNLRQMVKFRNRLVHEYWDVDDKKVLDFARKDISDFKDFIKLIDKQFLKKI